MIEAITPEQVKLIAGGHIPDYVVTAFNDMIKKKYVAGRAVFTQDEIIAHICAATCGVTEAALLAYRLLDVEPIFIRAGWRVEYDKPAYYENYKAKFIFTS